MDTLTFKQQKFCDEYLISYNAYRSAMIAGYSHNSARKAELLHIPKVQAYLKAAMAKNAQRAQVTHQRILREYEKIAFSNMGDYFDYKGVGKQIIEMTAEEKAALSYYEIVNVVDKDNTLIGEKVKIKLHNKMAALDKIARHTDFYNAKARHPITMDKDADTCDTAEDIAFEQRYGQGRDAQPYPLSREVAEELDNNWGTLQGDFEMAVEGRDIELGLPGRRPKTKNQKPREFNLAVEYGPAPCIELMRAEAEASGDVVVSNEQETASLAGGGLELMNGEKSRLTGGLVPEQRGEETIENLLTISPLEDRHENQESRFKTSK